jgi:hypothetical protein
MRKSDRKKNTSSVPGTPDTQVEILQHLIQRQRWTQRPLVQTNLLTKLCARLCAWESDVDRRNSWFWINWTNLIRMKRMHLRTDKRPIGAESIDSRHDSDHSETDANAEQGEVRTE